MKKILLFILIILILPMSVNANDIFYIDIDVILDKNGKAQITETWNVEGSKGSEWCKPINNLKNMKISNFTVSMDGTPLTYKNWKGFEFLKKKKGYYGIKYTKDGANLCFGKYDYDRHTFTLNYTLSNFIINTNDSQLIYHNFIDKIDNVNLYAFNINISSYYDFDDNLTVNEISDNYTFVNDGKITVNKKGTIYINNYSSIILVKFPLNTFNTINTIEGYENYNTVYSLAKKDKYKYNDTSSFDDIITDFIFDYMEFIILTILLIYNSIKAFKKITKNSYGYANNKKIDINNIPIFRNIPCNKDIYYAYTLMKLNKFNYNEENIFGAIIIKWIKEEKIKFKIEQTDLLKKEISIIDLTLSPTFDNKYEQQLFSMMYEASNNGLLNVNELEKWSEKNYSKLLNLVKEIINDNIEILKKNGYIYERKNKEECKQKYIMNNIIYKDSAELYGFKKYLETFSSIDTKKVLDVKLWDENLIFACLFGISNNVIKQLNNIYPETSTLLTQSFNKHKDLFNFDKLIFFNKNTNKRHIATVILIVLIVLLYFIAKKLYIYNLIN